MPLETVVSIKLIIKLLRGYTMKTLNIGINEFNLDEMDGNDLHRLAQGLISDLIYFSNHNIDDDFDATKDALDELLEHSIFDYKGDKLSPYEKVMKRYDS